MELITWRENTSETRFICVSKSKLVWCQLLIFLLLCTSKFMGLARKSRSALPSELTLRDYTNIKCKPGYQQEVVDMIKQESNCEELPECRKYVTLLFDEMKVKEDIVYDKVSGDIISFCNLETLNDVLLQAKRVTDAHPPIVKHIMAIMICGLLFKFEFPLARFATDNIIADLLYPLIWEGFVSLKVSIKTACNCLSYSHVHSHSRSMQVSQECRVCLYKLRKIFI